MLLLLTVAVEVVVVVVLNKSVLLLVVVEIIVRIEVAEIIGRGGGGCWELMLPNQVPIRRRIYNIIYRTTS